LLQQQHEQVNAGSTMLPAYSMVAKQRLVITNLSLVRLSQRLQTQADDSRSAGVK